MTAVTALATGAGTAPVAPAALAGTWPWRPAVVLALAVTAAVYAVGVRRLWRSAGHGQVVARPQVAAFWAGWAALAAALHSPLERLAESLFAAHMVQHVLLAIVAPPLLWCGRPLLVGTRALPPRMVPAAGRLAGRLRRLGGGRGRPLVPAAAAAFVATWWLWHVPALHQAALADPGLHVLEHATLLAAGAAFWLPVVRPRRTPPWVGPVLLFAATVSGGLLAALLEFSPTAWFPRYGPGAAAWGLTTLADQQLAAAVMWVPGGVVYLAAAALCLTRWLHDDQQAQDRRWAREV